MGSWVMEGSIVQVRFEWANKHLVHWIWWDFKKKVWSCVNIANELFALLLGGTLLGEAKNRESTVGYLLSNSYDLALYVVRFNDIPKLKLHNFKNAGVHN